MRHLWIFLSGLAAMAAVTMLVSCGTAPAPDLSGGGDDSGSGIEAYTGPVVGRVKGVVMLPDGTPLEDVTVQLMGTDNATFTDDNGYYELTEISPSDEVKVRFTKHGYTVNVRDTNVDGWETRTLNARLLQVDAIGSMRAGEGGTIQTDELRIDFQPGAFVGKASGEPVFGNVEIAVTHIDPTTDEIYAAPNDFTALAGDEMVGLMSYAMVDVQMTDEDGEEVELAEDAMASVELAIPDDLPELQQIQVGDTIPYWHFDEDVASWVLEGETTVMPSTTDPGRLAATIDAPYFSAWNLDDCWMTQDMDGNAVQVCANQPITCVTGVVKDVGHNPVIGADVASDAVNFAGAVNATTDEDGRYILYPIMQGAIINVNVEAVVGQRLWTAADGSYGVTAPNGVSLAAPPTDPSQCMEIPEIELPTCVVGAVVEVSNQQIVDPVFNGDIADASAGRAYFFEPDGTPETCVNIDPTDLPEDSCEIVPSEDVMMDFFWGQAPIDAGHEVVVETGNDTLTMDPTVRIPGDTYYEASSTEAPLPHDSMLDIYAWGQPGGIAEVDLPAALPMGGRMDVQQPAQDQLFQLRRGDNWGLRTNAEDDSWGGIAVIAPEDTSNGVCLCRFKDDGNFEVPGWVSSQLPEGPATMMMTRVKTRMEQLPNGYWARTMGLSSTAMVGEITP